MSRPIFEPLGTKKKVEVPVEFKNRPLFEPLDSTKPSAPPAPETSTSRPLWEPIETTRKVEVPLEYKSHPIWEGIGSDKSSPTSASEAQVAPAAGPKPQKYIPAAEPEEFGFDYDDGESIRRADTEDRHSVVSEGDDRQSIKTNPTVGPGAVNPLKKRSTVTSYTGTDADKRAAYVIDKIRNAVLWTNPIHSLIAVSSILGAIYILSHYSPIRIFSFLAAIAIGANLAFVNVWVHGARLFTDSHKSGVKKPPTMWYLDNTNRNLVHHQHVQQYSELVADLINVSFGWLASIIAIDNNARSAEALFGALALYWLSGVMKGWTLLTAIVLIAFTTPVLYANNKEAIDARVGHAQSIASDQYARSEGSVKGVWARFKGSKKHL
ncbi:hypothetical protein HK097_009732 [Rhizophlyctis rosea]|uniref:Reticulon-like protein n=1 Tax=Rhizophlyctis rosea TaxID=64517 RepID=A0AAD5SJ85_9FUNG|nr:hypothetical protein HK097_009732 [Rhizophlyctis rosea]